MQRWPKLGFLQSGWLLAVDTVPLAIRMKLEVFAVCEHHVAPISLGLRSAESDSQPLLAVCELWQHFAQPESVSAASQCAAGCGRADLYAGDP